MIRLDATTKIIQLIATATAGVVASGSTRTATTYAGFSVGTAAPAATQTIGAAPTFAGQTKDYDHISIKSTGGGNTLTVQWFNSSGSVTTPIMYAVVAANETLEYTHAHGWQVRDANGAAKYTVSGIALASGKTLAINNSLTFAGTDATVMTFPTTSATIARTDAGQTFTGVQSMTSPDITTSITTPSTTFALFNATATTVNAFAAATAIN